ncbi:MAG: uroporphyrinogen-III synthase [Nitrososphaerota archaeon]|nr:uroporphyrinogen-III synthase [Nitrososphaerota archaeon]
MKRRGVARSVLVARSREGNEEVQSKLAGTGISCLTVETIRFEEPADWRSADKALRDVESYDWAVFTSPRAAAVFETRLKQVGIAPPKRMPKLAAVGSSTASALERAGRRVEYVPDEYRTEALGEGLPDDRGKRVLLFRADIGDKALAVRLAERGFEVTDVAAYQTTVPRGALDPRAVAGTQVVVFASPSEVMGLRERLGEEEFGRIANLATAACIGPVTGKAAKAAGFTEVSYPRRHTVDGLVQMVKELAFHD